MKEDISKIVIKIEEDDDCSLTCRDQQQLLQARTSQQENRHRMASHSSLDHVFKLWPDLHFKSSKHGQS